MKANFTSNFHCPCSRSSASTRRQLEDRAYDEALRGAFALLAGMVVCVCLAVCFGTAEYTLMGL